MKTIKTECDCCGGTGLYEGCLEREGFPKVCLGCIGSGNQVIRYKPFSSRKNAKGIKGVVVGVKGGKEEIITYHKFLASEKYKRGQK